MRAGEVTGIAGLQGSGRTSLARALFGAAPFTEGTMTVTGRPRPTSPRQAIRAGIALVTEDRKAEGWPCASPYATTRCSSPAPYPPAAGHRQGGA